MLHDETRKLLIEAWALIQTHLNSTNNSVVVLHKNASS